MSKSGLYVVVWIDRLLWTIVIVVILIIIVEVDEVGVIVVVSLPLWAVTYKMSLLATLEARVIP